MAHGSCNGRGHSKDVYIESILTEMSSIALQ